MYITGCASDNASFHPRKTAPDLQGTHKFMMLLLVLSVQATSIAHDISPGIFPLNVMWFQQIPCYFPLLQQHLLLNHLL